jgi:hypothetical protein
MAFASGFGRAVAAAVIRGGVAGTHFVPGGLKGPTVGSVDAVADAVFGTPTGRNVTITSAGGNLTVLATGALFIVRDNANAANNGLYRATGTPSATSLPCTKLEGPAPAAQAADATNIHPVSRRADTLVSVRRMNDDFSVNTDLTSEFMIADNKANSISNVGGTNTTGSWLVVTWARVASG